MLPNNHGKILCQKGRFIHAEIIKIWQRIESNNIPLSSADGSALRRCCDVDVGGPMSARSRDLRSRSVDLS